MHDRQVRRMQDPARDHHEPDGAHEGQWPQEAMYVLGIPPSPPTWQSLLQPKSIVDVLRGHEGRREDRPERARDGEDLARHRGKKGKAK